MTDLGKLYLIPSPLGDNDPAEVIPAPVLDLICRLDTFVVEELRTARRYLSKAGLKGRIEGLRLCEAVADPGAPLVALCHRKGIQVVPLTGPSSIMLALMASGLNGQSFAFCGYLPAKADQRRDAIRSIEKTSVSKRQTQIFIETPYRNDAMFADLLGVCKGTTRICVAADITLPSAYIKTMSAERWKKEKLVIGKRPCVFLILA